MLALHLTPGRRLLPTLEKYKELSSSNPAPDSFQEALLHLLQDRGWSNSLEDLARSIEAHKDDEPNVTDTVNKLLCKLLEILAWSGDYKLKDMAHRHELKFTMSVEEGGCVHKMRAVVKHQCYQVSLLVKKGSDAAVTAEQLKEGIDGLLKCPFVEEPCGRCDTRVQRTLSLSIQHGCDPDFITVVCDVPICFRGVNFTIPFSNSRYRLMAVVHWDIKARKSAVSREKEDGWWWHGVDMGQAQSFKYSPSQVQAWRHLQDACVLMLVRVDDEQPHNSDPEEDMIEQVIGVGEELRGAATDEHSLDLGDQSADVNGAVLLTKEKQKFNEGGELNHTTLTSSRAGAQSQQDMERAQVLSVAENNVSMGNTGLGDGEIFDPPSTSTQRDRSHGKSSDKKRGSEKASSDKRPRTSTAEEADNERGTQVGTYRILLLSNVYRVFFSGLFPWDSSFPTAEQPTISSVPLWL